MASAAPELVNVAPLAGHGDKFSSIALSNPTPGAKEISPERRVEIQAALKRQARRIGYRFLLLHLKTQCVLALLCVHFAMLMARAKLERSLAKLVARIGHRIPLAGRSER